MPDPVNARAVLRRPGQVWRNWGRSVSVLPQFVAQPTSTDEVVDLVREARDRGIRVKATGAGHSFSGITVATGLQLDVSLLTGLLGLDGTRATFAAGTTLRDASALLHAYGLAFENLGDVDVPTIGGAIATGTHGTGARFGGLASRVVGLTMVTADARVLVIDDEHEMFPAAIVGLGALGVVVDVTIETVPAFAMHALDRSERVDTILEEFDARVAGADHVEFYWFPHTDRALTRTNTRLPTGAALHPRPGLARFVDDRILSNALFGAACRLGSVLPGAVPVSNRLATRIGGQRQFADDSGRVFTTPRHVRFRETEYALPLEAVPTALAELRRMIDERGWRISFPVEVRTAASDTPWLSMAHGRPTGYIAAHRYYREDPVPYFRAVGEIMRAHGGRPHWGKIHFDEAASLATSYSRHADFVAMRDRLDPDRVFANGYLDRVLGA